jgi:uncharacterized coiled-coil protein SlyX
MLATDVNNPAFVGATDPDAMLYVEFYYAEPLDRWSTEEASAAAGRLVKKLLPKQPYVRIMRPGDQLSIIETPVRESHKQRWPEKWLYFQMNEGLIDEGKDFPGWKIEEWPFLLDKADLTREFKHTRFHTVEQIAGASDAQVQRMGMGGPGFREQARVDLRNKYAADVKDQIAEKDKTITEMQKQMKIMLEQVAALTEAVTAPKKHG